MHIVRNHPVSPFGAATPPREGNFLSRSTDSPPLEGWRASARVVSPTTRPAGAPGAGSFVAGTFQSAGAPSSHFPASFHSTRSNAGASLARHAAAFTLHALLVKDPAPVPPAGMTNG